MKRYIVWATLITALITLPVGWVLGWWLGLPLDSVETSLLSPIHIQEEEKQLPLNKYALSNLIFYPYQASQLMIESPIETKPSETFSSYLFSFQTLGKTMTGRINIPTTPEPADGYPVIVLVRGWVPAESYYPGFGTQPAAAVFAQQGYITIAPDFFGYGQSEAESNDSWEARFQKPMNLVELIATIRQTASIEADSQPIQLDPNRLGMWAHSNGGQIALTTLEILAQPIPTTLWAPVSAPFPYSILFYSDENPDEGKQMRAWLTLFERDYDVFDFSLTKHLDRLTGPLQIHQGTADDAVPLAWNTEFVEKLEQENIRRSDSDSSSNNSDQDVLIEPIEYQFFTYLQADHNLQPGWNTAIERDLEFFSTEL